MRTRVCAVPAANPKGRAAVPPSRPARRWPHRAWFAGAGVAALLAPLLALAAAPAGAAPADPTTSDPSAAAAGYLARQLAGGTHVESGGFVQYGITADAVFGMAAAKVASRAQTAATGYLAANADAYIDSAGTFDGPFPGAYAKLALLAEVTGGDPHAFGGVDLLGKLSGLECPATGRPECAGTPGLFRTGKSSGGSPSVVTQALAVLALSRSVVADHPDSAAVDFLAGQACPDGGFPLQFPADGTPCVSEVDGTAYAVQGLLAAGRTGSAGTALDWLGSARHSDGSYVGNNVANANSTAVAVQALIAGGRNAAPSISWLRDRQIGCTGPDARRGAVTYAGTFDDRALQATTQAAAALAGQPLTTLTAAGSTAAAPVLACALPPTSPAPTATPTVAPTPAGTPPPAAAPTPELPDTNAVDGAAIVLLAAAGAALVGTGAVALLFARRRA